MSQFLSWMGMVMLLKTLSEVYSKERNILNVYQPLGPLMCEMKCQLNLLCDYPNFIQETLTCELHKKIQTVEQSGEKENGGNERTDEAKTGMELRDENVNKEELLRNVKNMMRKCRNATYDDVSQCLLNRRNEPRCIPEISAFINRGYVTPTTPIPVSQTTDLRKNEDEPGYCRSCLPGHKTCSCPLGCSKKTRGHNVTCHRKCEKYGKTFTRFSRKGISLHNRQKHAYKIKSKCQDMCLKEKSFLCLSFEHQSALPGGCFLTDVAWLDVNATERIFNEEKNWAYFHRNCA